MRVVALAGNPDETHRAIGAYAVGRRDKAAIARELESAAALVFGGGGLLQDATSIFSLNYYCGLITQAKKMGKKVILLAQGVGPIESFLGKRTASNALKLCDLITVRDAKSQSVVRSLGFAGRVEITADLAWLVKPAEGPDSAFQLGDMKAVAIAPRPWGKTKQIAEAFGGFTQILFKNGYVPVLVEMDRSMDTAILDTIAKLHGGRCPDIRKVLSPADMLNRIGRMHAVVSMRLHAGIFAASAGIAPLMISYDPKVSSFATTLGLQNPLPVEAISPQRLWDTFRNFEDKRGELNAQVAARAEEQRNLAMKNIELLVEALGVGQRSS